MSSFIDDQLTVAVTDMKRYMAYLRRKPTQVFTKKKDAWNNLL